LLERIDQQSRRPTLDRKGNETMLRTTIPAAIALACLAVVETAHAQTGVSGFGNHGQFIVSADRLFGLSVWSVKNEPQPTATDPNPADPTKESGTSLNLLWGGDSNTGTANNTNASTANAPIYSIPRLGFDYVLIPGLTVGGSVGYFHRGGSTDTTMANGITTTADNPSGNAILFEPRAGYIFDFTPLLSVWARGGFTYYWYKSQGTTVNNMGTRSTTNTSSTDGLAITIDPQLVITPVPHFGITVGPMVDLPLAGSTKGETTVATTTMMGTTTTTGTTEDNHKITNWGISAGILGYF
jgi:hypothetical protein